MPGTPGKEGYPPLKEGFTRKDMLDAMAEKYDREPVSPLNKIMGIALLYIAAGIVGSIMYNS